MLFRSNVNSGCSSGIGAPAPSAEGGSATNVASNPSIPSPNNPNRGGTGAPTKGQPATPRSEKKKFPRRESNLTTYSRAAQIGTNVNTQDPCPGYEADTPYPVYYQIVPPEKNRDFNNASTLGPKRGLRAQLGKIELSDFSVLKSGNLLVRARSRAQSVALANLKVLNGVDVTTDRKSTRLNSSHRSLSRMPSSA